jgi:hypothetical protein
VESRGRPIKEQPEGSGDSDPADCEAGHEKAGQEPLSLELKAHPERPIGQQRPYAV